MSMSADWVRLEIAAHRDAAGSLRKLAKRWGLSVAYLSDVMLGRRNPGPAILKRLKLRCIRTVTYRYVAGASRPKASTGEQA